MPHRYVSKEVLRNEVLTLIKTFSAYNYESLAERQNNLANIITDGIYQWLDKEEEKIIHGTIKNIAELGQAIKNPNKIVWEKHT